MSYKITNKRHGEKERERMKLMRISNKTERERLITSFVVILGREIWER